MRWAAEQSRGKVVYLHPNALDKPRRRLRWRWYRCWPLVAMGTIAVIITLATMLQAWLLSQPPEEIWRELYLISIWGR